MRSSARGVLISALEERCEVIGHTLIARAVRIDSRELGRCPRITPRLELVASEDDVADALSQSAIVTLHPVSDDMGDSALSNGWLGRRLADNRADDPITILRVHLNPRVATRRQCYLRETTSLVVVAGRQSTKTLATSSRRGIVHIAHGSVDVLRAELIASTGRRCSESL